MMNNKNLEIISWNSRSLYANLLEFKIFLYCTKPHIVCICESWLKPSHEPSFINYTSYFNHRINKSGGGTAILVRNDICAQVKDLNKFQNGQLEIQAITVFVNNEIDIINIYNPSKPIVKEEFIFYFKQIYSNAIIVGDFNAHHKMWDSRSTPNKTGHSLVDCLIELNNLELLTPLNFPTYLNVHNNSTSTLDLSFVSPSLCPGAQILLERPLGSDHRPIRLSLPVGPTFTERERRQLWKIKEVNWSAWRSALTPVRYEGAVEVDYSNLVSSMTKACETTMKKCSKVINLKYATPWWTEECKEIVNKKHRARNILRKYPTPENLINFKRIQAQAKIVLKRSKRESFKKYCSSINDETPISEIWNKIAAMQKKNKIKNSTPLITLGEIYTDSQKKSDVLASKFEKTFNSKLHKMNSMPLLLPLTAALVAEDGRGYNSPIGGGELLSAIRDLKMSAPGYDLIHNQMIKNLPPIFLDFLVKLFNDSLGESVVPPSWKKAIIVPILKPEKDRTNVDSYRPISLLPCLPKLMEKIICARLSYFIEKNQSLSINQGGFRKHMSTLEQIGRLENQIRLALVSKEVCVAIFIDLSKAYDCVWHTGLLYKLQECGIKGKILNWLKEYLSNRTFMTYHEGKFSELKQIQTGLPQGSILSPLLFNIMVRDLPRTQGITNLEYADDITLVCRGLSLSEVGSKVESHLEKFYRWSRDWGFDINVNKNKAMLFNRKNISPPIIKMNNMPIKFVQSNRYLGIIFDAPKLSWKDHIQYLSSSSLSKINIMKAITRFHWGADREILLRFYKSVIRGKIDYGAVFYGGTSHVCLKKLDVIQNSCLRLALGVKKTSPVSSLEVESNVMPLNYHRNFLTLKYYMKVIDFPSWHPFQIETNQSFISLFNQNWERTNNLPPLHIKAIKLLEKLNFEFVSNTVPNFFSPIIPWKDVTSKINLDFAPCPVSKLSNSMANIFFQELINKRYKNYLQIYTDGSCIKEPNISSACAFVIIDPLTPMKTSFKLNQNLSILGCELYAIFESIKYVKKLVHRKPCIIFSDSLSGLQAIANIKPKIYNDIIYEIQNLLAEVNEVGVVELQYVPGHRGILGNEEADTAAKLGHNNSTMDYYLGRSDKVRMLKTMIVRKWEDGWLHLTESLQKGLHLKLVKNKIEYWPWTSHKCRLVETLFARLRIGHVNVNEYLFKIGKSSSNLCSCGSVESVEHLLIHCSIYRSKRGILVDKFRELGIEFNIRNILGGGGYDEAKQLTIINLVVKYLYGIKRLRYL